MVAGAIAGGSTLAKVGKALWTAGKQVPKVGIGTAAVGGAAVGAGFAAGKGVFGSIGRFFRSFFPFNVYDWFFVSALLMHLFVDYFVFGFNYSNSNLFHMHFWFAIVWAFIFTAERSVGMAILPAILGNLLMLITVWVVDSIVFPMLRTASGNPNFIIFNRILLPIWPIFALAYAYYKRKEQGETSPFIRRAFLVCIFIVIVLFSGELRVLASGLPHYGDAYSAVDKVEAGEYISRGIDRTRSSISSSFEFIKYFVTFEFLQDELRKLNPESGNYQQGQDSSIGVKIDSIRLIPPNIDYGSDDSMLRIRLNFNTYAQLLGDKGEVLYEETINPVIRRELDSLRVRVYGASRISGEDIFLSEDDMKCNRLTLGDLINRVESICRPDLNYLLSANDEKPAKLRAIINYDFATIATKTFFFMHESLRQFNLRTGKEEDAYKLYFENERPTSAENTGGPLRIGVNADGEMMFNPLLVSEERRYLFLILIEDVGQGKLNSIEKIYIYAPSGMEFKSSFFSEAFLSSVECREKFFGDQVPFSDHVCHVMDKEKIRIYGNLHETRNQYFVLLSFALSDSVLSGNLGKSEVYVRIDYNYNITSPEIGFQRPFGLSLTE
ncbi:MAG TPA: hypothetical protein ENN46_00505 [Candidatus Woesearchaeota archaeon]|nr:hypothetical protein [Candidatus Woesearchaeota archaeon]